jgi:hypothetical protein
MLLLLQTGMIGAFVAADLFLFFIFWEVMLVPMYFLIGIWGGKNRLYSAIKFFLYTLVGSVVMLLAVLKLYFVFPDVVASQRAEVERTADRITASSVTEPARAGELNEPMRKMIDDALKRASAIDPTGLRPQRGYMDVHRVFAIVRHKGADVPVSHLAS